MAIGRVKLARSIYPQAWVVKVTSRAQARSSTKRALVLKVWAHDFYHFLKFWDFFVYIFYEPMSRGLVNFRPTSQASGSGSGSSRNEPWAVHGPIFDEPSRELTNYLTLLPPLQILKILCSYTTLRKGIMYTFVFNCQNILHSWFFYANVAFKKHVNLCMSMSLFQLDRENC